MEYKDDHNEMLHLWTAQTEAVVDCIRETGYSQVKMEYIDRKYQESAWVFREAYSFFIGRAAAMVTPPKGAESPIWLFGDRRWVYGTPGDYLLELSVPKGRVLLFDRPKWQRVLNLAYVGVDEAEEKAFEQRMERMGVETYFDVFRSQFYPYLKSEIKKSWDRVFDIKDVEQSDLGAAVWQLRCEDLIKVVKV